MSATRHTYQVHIMGYNVRSYGATLRAYLKRHVQNGGVLPPCIAVPKGYREEARRVIQDLPDGKETDVVEIGGCLIWEVWFQVDEGTSAI